MKVCLDPGHGGRDSGASANGIVESDMTYRICEAIVEDLDDHPGIELFFTRWKAPVDKVSLAQRARVARGGEADLVVSVHCNASSNEIAHGLMAFHLPDAPLAERVAKKIQARVPPEFKRGGGPWVATVPTWPRVTNVLKAHDRPAVLIECGFLTNPGDAKALETKTVFWDLVRCISSGIIEAAEQGPPAPPEAA